MNDSIVNSGNSELTDQDFTAPKKEKFETGYKSLVDNYKIYLDNVSKSIASLSLILGWLVVSLASRQFFQNNSFARWFFIFILFVLFLLYALALYDNYKEGNRIVVYLEKLQYIESETYDRYKPKSYKTISSILLTLLLGILVVVFIWIG